MRTMEQRVADWGITAEATYVREQPMEGENTHGIRQDVYSVELKRGEATMTVEFTMGEGLRDRYPDGPDAATVLDALASDAGGYENSNGFESWAEEYGSDPDSRKAYATWEKLQAQVADLRDFLADDYDDALYETERM